MSKARGLADLGNAYSDGALSNRNVLINGDFKVSQRGDYATSAIVPNSGGYYLDRWSDWGGVARTMQRLTASINGVTQNTLKYVCTTGATGTYMGARQFVEAINLQDGQQYTISCMMRTNNANARIRTYDFNGLTGGVTSDACPSDGNWHKITLTQTHTSAVNPQVGFLIYSGTETTVDIATNDYVEVANFQCEVGGTATPFEHRSYGDELQKCMRYFTKIGDGQIYTRFGLGYNWSGTVNNSVIHLPTQLRTLPTLTTTGVFGVYNAAAAVSAVASVSIETIGCSLTVASLNAQTSGLTQGSVGTLIAANSAGAALYFDAEL